MPVVEEHDDDPERRARAAAAMNAIARHTLAVESAAAGQTDADEMPEAALAMDEADAASSAEVDEAVAEAEVRADVAAALDELPEDIINAALEASYDETPVDPAMDLDVSGAISDESTETDVLTDEWGPEVVVEDPTDGYAASDGSSPNGAPANSTARRRRTDARAVAGLPAARPDRPSTSDPDVTAG